jgi:hypothetical protein
MRIKYKTLFYFFMAFFVCVTILEALRVFGFDKYGYFAGGAVYACLHFVLHWATIKWRGK